MVNSLTSAVEFGPRAAQANGKNFEIVVPLYSRLMAKGAGKNVAGSLEQLDGKVIGKYCRFTLRRY